MRVAEASETGLALAKFHLGRLTGADARSEAERLAQLRQPAHRYLAMFRLALGDTEQANHHTLTAYKWAWADGEPYVDRYDLTKTTELLKQMNVPIPQLQPYDSTKDDPSLGKPTLPFPPIDDNGNQIPITNSIPDQNQPLLQLASRMIPGRFVVQFNFLMTSNTANPAVSAAATDFGTLTAFQVNNWYGSLGPSGSACGGTVNQPTACDDATYLDLLQRGIYPLGRTNQLRSQYIEVWATNAITFTNAIWQAHQEFFGP